MGYCIFISTHSKGSSCRLKMNFKVTSVCVYCLFLAFLVPQTQTEFHHEDINWTRVKNYAIWTNGLLAKNKELIHTAPKTFKFIKSLATNVKSFVSTVNPAYAAATLYVTGVVAISYHYSVEAQQNLQKAQFKSSNLEMIIKTEIKPILKFLERLHAQGDTKSFCKAKNDIQNLFGTALTSLATVRKDIEEQMINSASGTEKNKILQWLSLAGGIGGAAVVATAPCLTTSLLACPQAVAGSSTLLSSVMGFFNFRGNKLTHEETMELLKVSRQEAYDAEWLSRRARTEVGIICSELPSFPVNQLTSLNGFMAKEHRLQLEHDNSRRALPYDSSDL